MTREEMINWDSIKEAVEKNGDVQTVMMEMLRDAHGSAKLGVNVRAQITSQLAGIGLGHVPESLPIRQDEHVRLYKKGTFVGDLIDEVLRPSEPNDKKLVERLDGSDVKYAETIEQIRDLVSE